MNVILEKRRRPPLADLPISSMHGDEACGSHAAAIAVAVERAVFSDLRQQVRATRDHQGRPSGFWVVQTIR